MFLAFAPFALAVASAAGGAVEDDLLRDVPLTVIADAAARMDLELRMDELGLVGAAPLYGAVDLATSVPAGTGCPER